MNCHSMDQYYCQRCETMGCEKVLDQNMITELRTRLTEREKKLVEVRTLLGKERDEFGAMETKLLMKCVNEHAHAKRVIEWMKDPKRKLAITTFTEGPDRQIAYAFEGLWGKTQFCMECERWAKKAERYREALEAIEDMGDMTLLGKCCVGNCCDKPCEVQLKAHSAFSQAAEVAKSALSGGEDVK